MKNRRSIQVEESRTMARIWILFGLGGITLYLNPRMEDPFNTPKFIILTTSSLILLAAILSEIRKNGIGKYLQLRTVFIILSIFIFSAFTSALLTDVKFTAFFGEYQRRNGFLTYFSLVVFLIYSLIYSIKNDIKYFLKNVLWISAIFSIYGAIQSQGIDFFAWNNPYNSIIATVGNPNFASALASIMACALFAIVFSNQFNPTIRFISFFFVLLNLFIIIKSQSRQGIVSFGAGFLAIVSLIAWKRKKNLGLLLGSTSMFLAIVSIMGMFQIGPLERFLYKESVSVRGFYWRAGFEMFKSNPIFGIGLDRYGAYFKEFREPAYPLRYGYDITSTNAHNVIIQLFSTGGIIFGLSYLAIIFFIIYRSFKLISESTDKNTNIYIGIFGAWLAFQAQSLISIDNIGISIWGWVIGGILIGLSFSTSFEKSSTSIKKYNHIELFQPLVTTVLIIPALVISFMLYRSENHTWMARSFYNPNQPSLNPQLEQFSKSVISNSLSDPFLRFRVTGYLLSSGDVKIAPAELIKLHQEDSRNLDYLRVLSVYAYQIGDLESSIDYRNQILIFDPLNTNNILELAKLYISKSDTVSAENMKQRILDLDPTGENAQTIDILVNQ